jgi:hypothetical protein
MRIRRWSKIEAAQGSNGVWPWLIVLIVAGLIAIVVVLWQSEVDRLIWGNLWELLRSRRG